MAFVDIAAHVVTLANARNAEDAQLKKKHGLTNGLTLGSAGGNAYMAESRPAEQALKTYLESLDEPTLLKLEAVMYGGRNNNPNFRDLKDEVSDDSEGAIRTMLEKTPLGDYLAEGLVLARQKFIDLEGDL